jgi:uncharacterized protein YndB with AHSA1/START domain
MTTTETTEAEDLRIERFFEAPRDAVFAAWLDPEQLSKWYGPEHFTTPRETIVVEPRVGGRWELVMARGGSEAGHPLRARIVELVEPELLVLENQALPEHGIGVTRTRVELHDAEGGTLMVLTDGPYAGAIGEMAGQGWSGAFDKLTRLIAA